MLDEPTMRVTCPHCRSISFTVEVGTKATCPLCGYNWEPKNDFSVDWKFNQSLQPIADAIFQGLWPINKVYRKLGVLDRERGIDVRLELISGLTFEVQEKYRRHKYRKYWQFTIEYKNNPKTDSPGEFYHLSANYYFYAYANEAESDFTDWWIVDLNKFKEAYSKGAVKENEIKDNPYRSYASYLAFDWDIMKPYLVYKSD